MTPSPLQFRRSLTFLTPEAWTKSTTGAILRTNPTLPLPQLLIWVEEAYLQWRDRELGPETYDPLDDLAVIPDLDAIPNQDQGIS